MTVRLTAALAVVGLLGGWGLAQHPELLPGVTVEQAAATRSVLLVTLVSIGVGALLLLPSLAWLYTIFHRSEGTRAS